MSQADVHNFSIALDGFGTGDGITFHAPFGHTRAIGVRTSLRSGISRRASLSTAAKLQGSE